MSHRKEEFNDKFFHGIDCIKEHSDFGEEWIFEHFGSLVEDYRYIENLYTPDEPLRARIDDYLRWCTNDTDEDQGELLEEISLLAFRCLTGAGNIKSYQSYGPQYDLVVPGSLEDGFGWRVLMKYLRLKDWDTIIVEAKNTNDKVDTEQFARLCWIIDHIFTDLAGLGIFISRNSATGFPTPDRRQRSLQAARASQIIFHARTGKYVVVIDHDDIQKLVEPGALPRLLKAKMRDVEEVTGLPVTLTVQDVQEVDLPAHLSKHYS